MSDDTDMLKLPLDDWHRMQRVRAWSHSRAMRCRSNMKASWPNICGRAKMPVCSMCHMGQLILSGDNAAEALEALVPGDISPR
jgi:aminomethyltransferase